MEADQKKNWRKNTNKPPNALLLIFADRHNEQYDFLYLDLVLKVERNNDKHLLRTLILEAEDLFDKHNKWEVRALCGDIENKLGNSESAKQIYLEVKDKTDNGMLILHINDMLKKLA